MGFKRLLKARNDVDTKSCCSNTDSNTTVLPSARSKEKIAPEQATPPIVTTCDNSAACNNQSQENKLDQQFVLFDAIYHSVSGNLTPVPQYNNYCSNEEIMLLKEDRCPTNSNYKGTAPLFDTTIACAKRKKEDKQTLILCILKEEPTAEEANCDHSNSEVHQVPTIALSTELIKAVEQTKASHLDIVNTYQNKYELKLKTEIIKDIHKEERQPIVAPSVTPAVSSAVNITTTTTTTIQARSQARVKADMSEPLPTFESSRDVDADMNNTLNELSRSTSESSSTFTSSSQDFNGPTVPVTADQRHLLKDFGSKCKIEVAQLQERMVIYQKQSLLLMQIEKAANDFSCVSVRNIDNKMAHLEKRVDAMNNTEEEGCVLIKESPLKKLNCMEPEGGSLSQLRKEMCLKIRVENASVQWSVYVQRLRSIVEPAED